MRNIAKGRGGSGRDAHLQGSDDSSESSLTRLDGSSADSGSVDKLRLTPDGGISPSVIAVSWMVVVSTAVELDVTVTVSAETVVVTVVSSVVSISTLTSG